MFKEIVDGRPTTDARHRAITIVCSGELTKVLIKFQDYLTEYVASRAYKRFF